MFFGAVAVAQAIGAVLAHSVMLPDGRLRKGQVLQAVDIAELQAAGIAEVTVARLGAGDVCEDAAAQALALALDGAGLERSEAFTGRVNLKAVGPGIVDFDPVAIHALNRIHPQIT